MNNIEVAAISASIGSGVVFIKSIIDVIATRGQRFHERMNHLREQRESAYAAWLETIPQLAVACVNLREVEGLEQLGNGTLNELHVKHKIASTPGLKEAWNEVQRIQGGEMRSVLARIRLFSDSEIVNETRKATGYLLGAHLSTPMNEQIHLGDYQSSFTRCLKLMRKDTGSWKKGEALEPPGYLTEIAIEPSDVIS